MTYIKFFLFGYVLKIIDLPYNKTYFRMNTPNHLRIDQEVGFFKLKPHKIQLQLVHFLTKGDKILHGL